MFRCITCSCCVVNIEIFFCFVAHSLTNSTIRREADWKRFQNSIDIYEQKMIAKWMCECLPDCGIQNSMWSKPVQEPKSATWTYTSEFRAQSYNFDMACVCQGFSHRDKKSQNSYNFCVWNIDILICDICRYSLSVQCPLHIIWIYDG